MLPRAMNPGDNEMKGAIAIAAAAAGIAATPATTKVMPYAVQLESLPNGLRVALVRYDSPGLAAYYTVVRVGARNEVEPGHSGFAHLFEHMMFRGTKKFPPAKWEAMVKSSGASTNAYTSADQTLYHYTLPSSALPTIIELEADRFQHLTYPKPIFQTETKAVLGEYNKSYSNPEEKMEEVLLDLAFEKHTYKHTVIGFLADIEKMPDRYDYGLKFFQRFYRPDNCTIVVVGDFDPQKTMEVIRTHYGSWTGKVEVQSIPAEPPQKREKRKTLEWPSETKPRVMVGYHTPSLGTDVAAAAIQNVLSGYLFGDGSPLHRDLVLHRQIAEGLQPQYIDTRDPRLFYYLLVAKDAAALPELEKAVDAAIEELRAGKVDAARLEGVKSNRRYAMVMAMETPGQIAQVLAHLGATTGDVNVINTLFDRIAQVTPAEITAFAKKYFTPENRTVLTLTGKPAGRARAKK
jgi:zinc protease